MKKLFLPFIIGVLTLVLLPQFSGVFAQDAATAPGGTAYKTVSDFYSRRFFPVGQQAAAALQAASETQAQETENDTGDASTLDNLPKVGDTKVITNADGQEITMVLKSITQDGNEVSMEWEAADGSGETIGEALSIDGEDFIAEGAVAEEAADETVDATTQNTTETQDAAQAEGETVEATYDSANKQITYVDAEGNEQSIALSSIGLSEEWLNTLMENGGQLTVTLFEDGTMKLVTGSDDSGAKKWEYDPSAHLCSHYEGEAGNEKCTVVTTEQEYADNYIWASTNAEDPGAGPDGHFVAQRFNYDDAGNLTTVDYFAWTGGNRGGLHPEVHAQIFGDLLTKSRYMYRQDTVVQNGSGEDCEITAGSETCECNGTTVTTKYFNDPLPVDWDPVLTGTVVKDEYGSYWLDTGCEKYLLVGMQDGFDADKDGQSGADEMNSVDWENLVGKEITVRGHEVASDSEAGVYFDGQKAQMFEVVDMVTPEEKELLGDDFEAIYNNMVAVATAADPVHDGLIGSGEAPGALGVVNLFNGTIPTAEMINNGQLDRMMTGLAPLYLDNINADILADIRAFAIPELETALTNAEQARQAAGEQEAAETETNTENNQEGAVTIEGETDPIDENAAIVNNEGRTRVNELLNREEEFLTQFTNGGAAAF